MKTTIRSTLKNHLLLLAESSWSMTGYFIDEQRHKIPVQGRWQVEDLGDSLSIEIRLYKEDKTLILERLCVVLPESQLFNNWSEQRTPYGDFEGHIHAVEDTLLLQLESTQKIRSVEAFLKVFETEYELRGTMLEGDRQLGSWVLELLRLN